MPDKEEKEKKIDDEGCCKEDWDKMEWRKHHHHWHHRGHGGNGAVYGLGLVGALIYFIGQATNFESGLIAVLKAIVWPAYLSFYALKFFLH
jgi:hypothetical protein